MSSSAITPPKPASLRYQPARGSHVYVERGPYTHHGIDCGDGTVIDFAGRGGGKAMAMIDRITLAEFAQGAAIGTRGYGVRYSPEMTVARATLMIGRSGYDLFSNNCEHFASWCATGEHSSQQVEAVCSSLGIVGIGWGTPRVATGVLVGLGDTAPGSASNVMSGLAKLGGSAIGGVTVIAGASAVVGAGTMMLALRDKPCLTARERSARAAGRVGAVGGAAAGVAVAVQSMGALGVAGYGAAGISSALAALGAVGGGGMVAGLAVASVIPLLAASVLALLFYGLVRSRPSQLIEHAHGTA